MSLPSYALKTAPANALHWPGHTYGTTQLRMRPDASGRALLVVVHFLEVGVDHLVVARVGRGSGVTASVCTGLLLGLVHRLAELHGRLRERIHLRLDRRNVVAVLAILQSLDVGLDPASVLCRTLVAEFGEVLLRRV